MLDAPHHIEHQEDAPSGAPSLGAVGCDPRAARLCQIRRDSTHFDMTFLDDCEDGERYESILETNKRAAYKQVDDELLEAFDAKDVIRESKAFKAARTAKRRQAGKDAKKQTLKAMGLAKPPSSISWGIKSPTGAGKTTSLIEALKARPDRQSIDIHEPTHAKAVELYEDLKAAGVPADIERGMGCPDPDWQDRDIADEEIDQPYYQREYMCLQIKGVEEANKASIEIGEEFCKACPFAGRCGYHVQKARLEQARADGAHIVKTHARLDYNSAVGRAKTIVVDEDISRNMVKSFDISERKLSSKALLAIAGPQGHGLESELKHAGEAALEAVKSGKPDDILSDVRIALLRQMAKLLREAWKSNRPKLKGERDPEKIAELVENSTNDARLVAIIFDQVALAAEKGVVLRSITLTNEIITCRYVKRGTIGRNHNVLFMSANLRPDRMSAVLGKKVNVKVFDADRNIEIHHIKTTASNARLTGLRPDGSPYSGKSVLRAADRRQAIIQKAEDMLGPDIGDVLFVSNTTVEQAFLDDLPENWTNRHFGELAGLNEYSNHDAIVLIGQACPLVKEAEALSAAVALHKGKSVKTVDDWLKENPKGEVDDFGFIKTAEGPWHPDPFVRSEIAVMVEDQYDQSIGRIRAINSPTPKRVVIARPWLPGGFEAFAPPETMHENIGLRSMMQIYIDKRARTGFMPTTPKAASMLENDLFPTAEAFKKSRVRHVANGGTKPLSIKSEALMAVPPFARWKVEWKFAGRGSAVQTAYADREYTAADLTALYQCQVKEVTSTPIKDDRPDSSVPDPEPDPTSATDLADEVTVMTSLSKRHPLTKKFRNTDQGPVAVKAGYPAWYKSEKRRVRDLDQMKQLLLDLESNPGAAIARGDLRSGIDRSRMRRLIIGDDATLRDVPSHWAVIDIDDLKIPGLPAARTDKDVWQAVVATLNALPEPFHGVDCIVRASSSMGITSPEGIAKFHLYFRLETALTSRQLKEALRGVMSRHPRAPRFDLALASPNQLAATGRPICDGFPDPIKKRVYKVTAGLGKTSVDLKPPKPRPQRRQSVDEIDIAMSDKFFEDALDRIGEGGVIHETSRRACWHAARAIAAGKLTRQGAIATIQNRILSLPAGHRTAQDMQERANPRKIESMISWHEKRSL